MSGSIRIVGPWVLVCTWLLAVAQADPSSLAAFHRDAQPLLQTFCYACHGPDEQQGGLRLDQLDPDLVNGADAETWNDALDQIHLGEMPPSEAEQPTPKQRRALTDWMQSGLREAAEARRFKNGRVLARRLTRYEYANTLRDLLGIDLDFARNLPPDPASPDGFLNNGATLEMSPGQIEVYLEVARKALSEVIVSGEPPKRFEVSQQTTATGNLPTKKVAGHEPVNPEFILDLREFPRHGEFELTVTAEAAIPPGHDLPRMRLSMGHVPGIIHVPRAEIGEVDVPAGESVFTFRGRMEDFPQPGPIAFGNSGFKGMIVMIDLVDADGKELRYPDRQYASKPNQKPNKKKSDDEANAEPADPVEPEPFGTRLDIRVTSAEFRSPVFTRWPPPSHLRLLGDGAPAEDESSLVRERLRPFMKRAFRRPVTDEEVEQTVDLFHAIRPHTDSLEAAIRETFASVLVSPHFLYIIEDREPKAEKQRVSEWELASRLSYFLWSSIPDQRLLDLAEQGNLRDPAMLREEVERMLASERGSEFVDRFVDQWLDLDALDRVAVNPEFFPDFEQELKQQMREETRAYVSRILHEDRSALELLDSDWAMLNRPLARHYGVEGPRSSQFECVSLKDSDRRGGLLWQGAFLLANANGEDSHPIKRAVWILDRLLASPPGSPPPDVPELNPERADLAKLTLKEQLEVHRQKESCASCHQGIDPWGVPLEHFDAVGRWRTTIPAHRKRPETDVDATSVLPDGTMIDGVRPLQQYLVTECKEKFARSVVRRLMAYGLGRSLDFGDREAVDALAQRFEENGFKLKPLIIDFVQSETFQTK